MTGTGDNGPAGSVDAGRWNGCYNALDRHVARGAGEHAALIYDAPVIAFRKSVSFAELLDEVATFAAVLADFGIGAGDRVLLFLPMIPRLHVAMLACARLGAAYVAVPAGSDAAGLAEALRDTAPRLVLTASCAFDGGTVALKPVLDEALARSDASATVLVWQRPRLAATMVDGRDHDWEALIEAAEADGRRADCVALAAESTLGILYTPDRDGSASKVVLRAGDTLDRLASANQLCRAGDVVWAVPDHAGPVGHALGLWAPLLAGATTICFEGDTLRAPEPEALSLASATNDVTALYLEPATLASLQASGPAIARPADDPVRSRIIGLVDASGDGPDAGLVAWAGEHFDCPVVELPWDQSAGVPHAAGS